MDSIAYEHGFHGDTLWNDPANASLKNARQNANVLLDGDHVIIPPLRVRQEPGATEKRHRFCLKGVPCKLRLRLLGCDGKPRSGLAYMLDIDGQLLYQGKTDSDGRIVHSIPPNAPRGRLLLQDGAEQYNLALGHVDPIDQLTGVQGRLHNLGFDCGAIDGVKGPKTEAAIREFQEKYGLNVDGVPGPLTQGKLKEVYGS
jgi:N-acetylmuramoyl-L-alanine amidase